jgi:signal transduction histidine kinase/ActR/RegA family two-component response regulator
MMGFPDRQALAKMNTADTYAHTEDRERFQSLMERQGAVRNFEAELRRLDGALIWVKIDAQAIRDADGRVLYYEGSMEDITERKQIEKQLRQQERLAAIGQLAGGIAHDFNNLIATIILCTQISLSKPVSSPDVVRNLKTILSESRRAAELIQQVLDFSRRSMIEIHPVDLFSFIENVIGVLRRTIPENIQITLDVQGEGEEKYIAKADPTRIQQVLMNLALNARDAMPDGGKLRVGLARVKLRAGEKLPGTAFRLPPGEWICMTVSDTGTGMTEEAQVHLYEPFFTTKEPGMGTGLGLAQVYGIVKQHGGYICVETVEGEGTTFCIYLLAYDEEGVGKVEAEKPSAPLQGKGETLLLVEDEARLREAMQEFLESLGYRVLTATDGRGAMEVYYRSAEKVALVIADLVMPEMGGKQLICELMRENPALKALAITGYVMQANPQELKEMGFLDIVNKPFDANRLAKVIRQALDADDD